MKYNKKRFNMNQKNRILEMGKRTLYTAEFEVKVYFGVSAITISMWKLEFLNGSCKFMRGSIS